MLFQWDAANLAHIALHGVTPDEAEKIVKQARRPYPRAVGDGKYVVRGALDSGRQLQVIFVYKTPEQIDVQNLSLEQLVELMDRGIKLLIRVIHAMPLSKQMTRRERRRRRR